MTRRLSSIERRQRRQSRIGWTVIIATVLATAAIVWIFAAIDGAQGLTVGESLALWGL